MERIDTKLVVFGKNWRNYQTAQPTVEVYWSEISVDVRMFTKAKYSAYQSDIIVKQIHFASSAGKKIKIVIYFKRTTIVIIHGLTEQVQ